MCYGMYKTSEEIDGDCYMVGASGRGKRRNGAIGGEVTKIGNHGNSVRNRIILTLATAEKLLLFRFPE